MKNKKFNIANVCITIALAALIFATWRVLTGNIGNLLHVFDGNGSGDGTDNYGAGLLIIILIGICSLLVSGGVFLWLISGIFCLLYALGMVIALSTGKRIKQLRISLIIYLIFAAVISQFALFTVFIVLRTAAWAKDFEVTALLALLVSVAVLGAVSAVISGFSLNELK